MKIAVGSDDSDLMSTCCHIILNKYPHDQLEEHMRYFSDVRHQQNGGSSNQNFTVPSSVNQSDRI